MTKDERHRYILRAAKALFQARGYDHVTIADVIAASNVARGTFYLHFDSLESLLMALFDEVVDETWRRIAPLLDDLSIPFNECTIAVIDAVFRMFDSDPSMGTVFTSGGGHAFMQRKQQAMYGKLGQLLVSALEKRHDTAVPTMEWTVAMLIALVGDMAQYALNNVPDAEKAAFEHKLAEFVIAGLHSQLAPHIQL